MENPFNAWITFGTYSADGFGAPTFLKLQHKVCQIHAYHAANGPVKDIRLAVHCPMCTCGKVHKCKAPKRHSNGYHGDACYKACPTCNGKYETWLDGVTGLPLEGY